jgi:LPS export ABC transporter protein LptC
MAQTTNNFTRVVLILGALFFIVACENSEEEINAQYKKSMGVEEAKNIVSYLSEGGTVKAKLTSPYMLRYQADSPYIEFPRTLHVDFYNDSAVIESTVDAKYAKYIEFDRKVLLRDSVVVLSFKNGDTLRTQELWWDQNKQEFYTDKPAHVHQRDKVIPAMNGLRAAQNLSWYDFYGVKQGRIDVPKETIPE